MKHIKKYNEDLGPISDDQERKEYELGRSKKSKDFWSSQIDKKYTTEQMLEFAFYVSEEVEIGENIYGDLSFDTGREIFSSMEELLEYWLKNPSNYKPYNN